MILSHLQSLHPCVLGHRFPRSTSSSNSSPSRRKLTLCHFWWIQSTVSRARNFKLQNVGKWEASSQSTGYKMDTNMCMHAVDNLSTKFFRMGQNESTQGRECNKGGFHL